jgi:hypothetical protein
MLGMIVVFIASYATGLGNVPWHTSELFPLEVRGMGSSALTASCWAANILISATFLTLMNSKTGAAGAFGICEFTLNTPETWALLSSPSQLTEAFPALHRLWNLSARDDFRILLFPRGVLFPFAVLKPTSELPS